MAGSSAVGGEPVTVDARALARRIVSEVFDPRSTDTPSEPAAVTEAQAVGRRIVAEILADGPPTPPTPPAEDGAPAAHEERAGSDEPTGSEVAARMVAEVLARPPAVEPPLPPPNPEDRVGGPEPAPSPPPPPPPEPTVTRRLEEDPPARTGRWILITIAAAIALAVLFPLTVRALLQLLSLS